LVKYTEEQIISYIDNQKQKLADPNWFTKDRGGIDLDGSRRKRIEQSIVDLEKELSELRKTKNALHNIKPEYR